MTAHNFIDMRGRTFGSWTVIDRHDGRSKKAHWVCVCACGAKAIILGGNLRLGLSTQCVTCRNRKNTKRTHQRSSDRVYRIWSNMVARCINPRSSHYDRYGGRGIAVCDSWRLSFQQFLADMGEPPAGTSLDRIDNDGNYEPGNCRWADQVTQTRNSSRRRLLTVGGVTKHLADWSRESGISSGTIHGRLARGWPVEDAVSRRPQE